MGISNHEGNVNVESSLVVKWAYDWRSIAPWNKWSLVVVEEVDYYRFRSSSFRFLNADGLKTLQVNCER
jgi:hypothetical protein